VAAVSEALCSGYVAAKSAKALGGKTAWILYSMCISYLLLRLHKYLLDTKYWYRCSMCAFE
jgi:hypothetical protein